MLFRVGTTPTKVRRHSAAGALIESLEARRLLSAGAFDTSFSFDGKVTSAFGTSTGGGRSVAIQGDGKILVAGFATGSDGSEDFAVARFNTDGTFDTTFGKNGAAILSPASALFNQGLDEAASVLRIGPGGKIVVGGTANYYNPGDGSAETIWEIARLNPNGVPDSTFGASGYSYATFNSTSSALEGLAVRADGSIVAVGSTNERAVVGVIGSNGFFSPAFNSVGYWISSNSFSDFSSVVVQSDGKIVAAGSGQTGLAHDFQLVRLTTSGALDPNFGVDGEVDTDPGLLIGLGNQAYLSSLALASNGDLIAGGTLGFNNGWVLARYRPDGSLSNNFGISGVTSAHFGGQSDLYGLALQRDGKIIVAGDYATSGSSDFGAAIGRIDSAGLFDQSFAGGSGYETAGLNGQSSFYAVAVQSDGKIVATGFNGSQMILARFLGDPPAVRSIGGSVINDTNANGVLDAGEKGIAGRTLYLDGNKNGKLDAGEKTATTAADGSYAFTNLAAGTYVVREVLPTSWRRTGPTAGSFTITLANGQTVSSKNFLETQDVIITGTVYNDANGNAKRDSTEKGISGRTVFIDKNKNGKLDAGEPKTTTAADGTYSFKAQPPGSYRLAQVVPTGWRISSPAAGYFDLSLTGAQTASGKSFGNTQLALISGTVFLDSNSNHKLDAADKPIAGYVVYLDANNNGKFDAGEKTFTTGADGKFSFVVVAGTYHPALIHKTGVGVIVPLNGYSLALGNGQSASGKNFLVGTLV
ncbi:MAG TPA: SdrD B-like domain-containing protein [Humisphaera sp.]|jgi:uncharacterized delta-60 repeat protein|nr:SdrD B-like domain-containing protein [Humisphaera sp.]